MSKIDQGLLELSMEQRELLEILLEQEEHEQRERTIPKRNTDSPPLSYAQERFWILHQLQQDSAVFNEHTALYLAGPLHEDALKRSFREMIRRHEVLRTVCTVEGGQLRQKILPELPLNFPTLHLQQIPREERKSVAEQCALEDARQAFDLEKGPFLRTRLLTFAADEHVLLLTVHHFIIDGWSMRVMARELSALYNSYVQGREPELPEPEIQYADYALWQRKIHENHGFDEGIRFWKNQLEGATTILDLPSDRPRPALPGNGGATELFELSPELSQRLERLCCQEGVTLFMLLVAAFQTLLYRYTRQSDMLIGTAVSSRIHPELEHLIGSFSNNILIRTRFEHDPTFLEVLAQVRDSALDAFAHQEVPFEILLDELQPERNVSVNPLFQALFILHDKTFTECFSLPGIQVEMLPIAGNTTKLDLNFHVNQSRHKLTGQLQYNTDIFERSTIIRLLNHYQNLLSTIAQNPALPISDLPVLSESERASLAQQCNLVAPEHPLIEFIAEEIEQPISRRFEKQVEKYPRNLAVRTRQYTWNYQELNEHANALAHMILSQYGSSEARAALLFEQDAPMISGMLGALKAGKTYVSLDSSYPRERLVYMLHDSAPDIIITNTRNLALAEQVKLEGMRIINISALNPAVSTENPDIEFSPDRLAYILYTSGLTGQPKGVMQNHRNVLYFIRQYTNNLHISPTDRLTLLSSCSFDAAVMDIYGALLNGASLHPFNFRDGEGNRFSPWLQEEGITIYHSTPTVYRFLMDTLEENEVLSNIRLVVSGGEAVFRSDFELYCRHFPDHCLFVNGFGPTESTLCLQYFLNKKSAVPRHSVPIGYPVEGTEVLLLNEQGKLSDVFGEIAIKSRHVALGYWQRPEQSIQAFMNVDEDTRIYRTGDMGRLLMDGTIEYIGRKDFQVKIRGYRIETSEIERRLHEHPEVDEAVVVAIGELTQDKRLAAYVVSRPEVSLTPKDLMHFLSLTLPDYMIPVMYTFLNELPLTPTGKIDRRSLPAPQSNQLESALQYEIPRNMVERKLAQIWSEVLRVNPVGIHDNFFELGGNSLAAIRLISRIQKEMRIDLPLRNIFIHSTIAGISQHIGYEEKTHQFKYHDSTEWNWKYLVPIQANGNRRPLFLVAGAHANEDEFLRYLSNLIPHLGREQPVYGFKPRGLDGIEEPHETVEEMATAFVQELKVFQPEGPYIICGECVGGIVAYEMAQQLNAQGEQVELILMDTPRPTFSNLARNHIQYWKNRRLHIQKRLWQIWNCYQTAGTRSAFEMLQGKHFTNGEVRKHRIIKKMEKNYPRILLRYRPKPFPQKITLLINEYYYSKDPNLGWKDMARGDIDVYEVPGDHMTRLTQYGKDTAKQLNLCLVNLTDI